MRASPTLILALVASTGLSATAAAQGGVTTHCQSGSNGALISASGSASFATNGGSGDLVLHADGVASQTVGLFFYGDVATQAVPFANGFLCVSGTQELYRLPVVAANGSTSVSHALDYLAQGDPGGVITPGSTWSFQFWFRDGVTSDLTDAIEVAFVPPIAVPMSAFVTGTQSVHPLSDAPGGGLQLIDNQADWDAFWQLHDGHIPMLPTPPVDFTQEVVVAAFAGRRFSTGYSISVTEVRLSVTSVDLTTVERRPGAGCGTFFSETRPFQFVLIRRAEGLTLRNWDLQVNEYTCP